MEKRKSLCLLLLSMVVVVIGFQVMISSITLTSAIGKEITENSQFNVQTAPDFGTIIDLNQITGINFTGSIESHWFYINLVLIVITPLGFILPTVLIKDKKKTEEPAKEASTEMATESVESQSRVDLDPTAKYGNIVGRIGMLVLFLENVIILITYIAFFVLIPTYGDYPDRPLTVLRTYFILFNIDFMAAMLVSIGLVVISLRAARSRIFAYLATGSWVTFIGVNIYPRIRLVQTFTGSISTGESAMDILENIAEYLTSFYGPDLTLQTAAYCFLALAIFFTTKFLADNSQLRSKGIVNAFGITNYVTGGLMNFILLLLLTYGIDIDPSLSGSLMIFYLILIVIKLIAVPITGLIASILTFSQMNLKKVKA
ncbi:MAG: hypothetical protein FK734_08405 [Asgard group archaeon]|nr:hypothetical protein [Asgard group archaeon]